MSISKRQEEILELLNEHSFLTVEKLSEMTEDDYKDAEKSLQKLTDDFIKEIDKIVEKKEKELTAI